MKPDINSISNLIGRFLDGSTSPTEEKLLYSFFKANPSGSLPAELEQFRPMFAWYAALPAGNTAASAGRRRSFIRYAAAAAITALLTAAALFTFAPRNTAYPDTLYAQYEGSYIVRNGKRITDIDKILVTVMRAEKMADSLSNSVLMQEQLSDNDFDSIMVVQALSGISDPELVQQLKDDLLSTRS